MIAGFAETAAMLWVLVREEAKTLPKPVDFAIDFLRSAGPRSTYAECEILRQGRRVAQVSVRCWQDDRDAPIAATRSHFLLEASAGQ